LFLLILPLETHAHPGNTDGSGGHTCRTNCEKWGLGYGEYHYHGGGPPVTPALSPEPKEVVTEPLPTTSPLSSSGIFLSSTEYMTFGALLVGGLIYFVYRKDKAGIWLMFILLVAAIGFYLYGENHWKNVSNSISGEIKQIDKEHQDTLAEKDLKIQQLEGDIVILHDRNEDLFSELNQANQEKELADQKSKVVIGQFKTTVTPQTKVTDTSQTIAKSTNKAMTRELFLQKFSTISRGMSKDDVFNILGPGILESSYAFLGDTFKWDLPEDQFGYVTVTFLNNQVTNVYNAGF
jgi:hypothetical protein